jgi:hypothetical protein
VGYKQSLHHDLQWSTVHHPTIWCHITSILKVSSPLLKRKINRIIVHCTTDSRQSHARCDEASLSRCHSGCSSNLFNVSWKMPTLLHYLATRLTYRMLLTIYICPGCRGFILVITKTTVTVKYKFRSLGLRNFYAQQIII